MKSHVKNSGLAVPPPEPTIWALRKNPRAANTDSKDDHSLYEHLFGYDPIKLARTSGSNGGKTASTSAENPNLNILNAGTNFTVREMASDIPAEENF